MTTASKPKAGKSSARTVAVPAIDPFSEHGAVPDWVRARHPEYARHAHAAGPVTSTRTIQAAGRDVVVRTTYEVFMDGEALSLSMMVDSDGRLWSHLCPYATFATATELVEYVLERVPEALTGVISETGHHEHHEARRRS
jgi:hypothetical protein